MEHTLRIYQENRRLAQTGFVAIAAALFDRMLQLGHFGQQVLQNKNVFRAYGRVGVAALAHQTRLQFHQTI